MARHHWLTTSGRVLAAVIVALILLRAALPYAVKWYVNRTINGIPDYSGYVGDIDMALWRGAYQIIDLELFKTKRRVEKPFIAADKIDLSVHWRALFHGKLAGKAKIFRPRVHVIQDDAAQTSQKKISPKAGEQAKKLFPFDINRIELVDGAVAFEQKEGGPPVDLSVRKLNLLVQNLTDVESKGGGELFSPVQMSALTVGGGSLTVKGRFDAWAKQPTFQMDGQLQGVDMTALNDALFREAGIEVQKGTMSVFLSAAAKDGGFAGYVKPLFKDVQFLNHMSKHEPLGQKIKEGVADIVKNVFENQPKQQVALRVPFQGRFDDPSVGVFPAVTTLLRNAYIQALKPSIDHSVGLPSAVAAKKKADKAGSKKKG